MSFDKQQLREIIADQLPSFGPVSRIESVSGGHLNHVWRVIGEEGTCIAKYTPPHIATQPDVPLDQHRAVIEARALEELNNGRLHSIPDDKTGAPNKLYFDKELPLLLMEDITPSQTLGRRILQGKEGEKELREVGELIGRLHVTTYEKGWAKRYFDNSHIQETRMEVQYRPIAALLVEHGIKNAPSLGSKASALGESLMKTGNCVIMGDLWPPSILVEENKQWLIDWELAHYGRPLQDVGHLIAHLWLYARAAKREPGRLIKTFLQAYRMEMGNMFNTLWDQNELRDAAIHAGAEIITRVLGAFRSNYLEGRYLEDEMKEAALQQAVELLRRVERSELLETLTA